jgi:toxin ParE1/3/4
MRLRIALSARRELDTIFDYWSERAGTQVAERLIDSITERFWLIAQFPRSGKQVPQIAPGVRCFPAGKYLIYYTVSRGTLQIVHIFHGAQDQKQAFRSAKKRHEREAP